MLQNTEFLNENSENLDIDKNEKIHEAEYLDNLIPRKSRDEN